MPQHWNNILVVTKEELVPTWFNTESTLKSNIQRYKNKDYGIKRVSTGGNGRQMLIAYDSLPPEIKKGLGDPRKSDHVLEKFYNTDPGAVDFFTTFTFDCDGTGLDIEHQEKYITNASVLKAVIKLRDDREQCRRSMGGSMVGITQTLLDDTQSFQKTLEKKHKVKHTLPPGLKQFSKVLKDFQSEGYVSLISGKHKSANALKVTELTIELLNNLFSGQSDKPTATKIHRQYSSFLDGYTTVINNNSGEIYNPKDFKKLSDATIKAYMAQWSNKIGNYAKRSGDRQKLMGQFKTYHSFEKVKFAGSMISIDDRQPPFKTLAGNRIWFYNGIDLGSEAFTCWVHGETKEGIITEFYRQMVRNYAMWGFNLPHELECEMSLNSSFRETFLREGAMFQKVKIEANNARGKRIERYFGELRYRIEKERTGWLARPTALSESNQSRVPIEQIPRVPVDDIINGCLQDIENWNNEFHSVHTNMTRWEVFEQMQHPNLKPTNYLAILPHIGLRTVTSCNVGIVRLNNDECLIGYEGKVASGAKLIQSMKLIEGKEVTVRWLDDNYKGILKAFAYLGTEMICELVRKPRYSRADLEKTDEDRNAEEIMSKYDATIQAFGRSQKAKLDNITIIDNTPSRPKTFIMPNLKRTYTSPAEDLGELLEDHIDEETQTTTTRVRTLKDRF